MQFIPHGPDIPDDMLQAHEEGRLVFFCGAGISKPAGLPDFSQLVDNVCEKIGTHLQEPEKKAFDNGLYDRALMLLERRLPGGAEQMRKAIWECLQPPLSDHLDLKTHEALLALGRDRAGMLRLITTNFDRLFIRAASQAGQDVAHLAAPQLPVPRNERWNGIVYLHGLLPERRDDSMTLKNLVVTSGDFGLAYLHDQWAARFVSEMLRTYNICFVGYSLGDAILRYMVDALAALRLEAGAEGVNCWALAANGSTSREQWEAKGVKPILYKENDRHTFLHHTLHVWAALYKDGLQAKETIISRNAPLPPDTGTEEDDFVGRVLWALADPSGAPAKHFAQLDPPPPLEWLLEAFYRKNSPLAPILSDSASSGWNFMWKILPWVVKHCHDPRLLLWILRQEEQQQVRWRELFRGIRLDDIGKEADLAEADKAYLRKVFALFRNGWIIGRNMTLTDLPPEEEAQRLSACLSLRQALVPHLVLRKGIQKQVENANAHREITYFWPEIILAEDASLLFQPAFLEKWRIILPDLAESVQQSLLDSLKMLEEMTPQTVNARRDLSIFCFPSISQHEQNRDRSARALLMHLLREAWESLHRQNPTAAICMAESWFGKPYPTFKRFALYAAAQDGVIAPARWVDWLRQDNGYWLCSSETRREVCRLLVRQGHSLGTVLREQLEEAILAGPPRDIFREDMSEEEYQGYTQYLSWLLLKKLSRNSSLSSHARSRLEQIEQEEPRLRREPDEQEEFPVWVGSPQDATSSPVATSALPQTCDGIARWVKKNDLFFSRREQWRQLCRERGQDCLQALQRLSRENIFPREFWWDAVQIWTQAISATAFHQELLDWLLLLPDNTLSQLAESCSWWLARCAEGNLLAGSASFIELCHKLLFLSHREDSSRPSNTGDIVNQALNSPQGNAARALLHLWSNSGLKDNAGLAEPYRTLLTELCDRHEPLAIHAHVFLGRYAITLYRVDRGWTEEYLLPLFDWQQNEWDASALWSGFLWTARFYPDLFMQFWSSFVACSRHYAELGALGRQYVQLATLIAIERMDDFPAEDFRIIFSTLPVEALPASLHWLEKSIEQMEEDHRAACVLNRVIPFFHDCWPKDRRYMTPEISGRLSSLCLVSPVAFPAVWERCRDSIGPVSQLHAILSKLQQSGICRSSPREALDFLDKICGGGNLVSGQLLGECLAELREAEPELGNTAVFARLTSLAS